MNEYLLYGESNHPMQKQIAILTKKAQAITRKNSSNQKVQTRRIHKKVTLLNRATVIPVRMMKPLKLSTERILIRKPTREVGLLILGIAVSFSKLRRKINMTT